MNTSSSKKLVIGIYGISGSGKSHVLSEIQAARMEWRCLEGSEVIQQMMREDGSVSYGGTGGGLVENVPRIIPDGYLANIDSQSWQRSALFQWLQDKGQVDETEMLRVFNCGMGMLVMLPKYQANEAIQLCQENNYQAVEIGGIEKSSSEQKIKLL